VRAVAAPGGAALAPTWVPAFFSNAPSAQPIHDAVPPEWVPVLTVAIAGYWVGFLLGGFIGGGEQ